eukprot:364184-Chlamydomonas_euryale.AAC.1
MLTSHNLGFTAPNRSRCTAPNHLGFTAPNHLGFTAPNHLGLTAPYHLGSTAPSAHPDLTSPCPLLPCWPPARERKRLPLPLSLRDGWRLPAQQMSKARGMGKARTGFRHGAWA